MAGYATCPEHPKRRVDVKHCPSPTCTWFQCPEDGGHSFVPGRKRKPAA